MIKPVKGGFVVMSHKTKKKLSRVYKKIDDAKKRLKQIQYFKRKGDTK